MSTNRDGDYFSGDYDRAAEPLLVIVEGTRVRVDINPACDLGFQLDRALAAKRDFVQELSRVSAIVSRQQGASLRKPHNTDDEELKKWEQKFEVWKMQLPNSLKLDEATCVERLMTLRMLGAGLYGDLSKDMKDKLQDLGFPAVSGEEDLALTFVQDASAAPILWDMMYDGTQAGLPDWTRFWGFRAPITHWVTKPRTNEIRLRKDTRVFSAINEELIFAGREVESLVSQLKPSLEHCSLATEFRERVHQALLTKTHNDTQRVEAWWQTCQADSWLKSYLNELDTEEKRRKIQAYAW